MVFDNFRLKTIELYDKICLHIKKTANTVIKKIYINRIAESSLSGFVPLSDKR